MKFDRCLEVVLDHEGGFVNHSDDPGGATNFGITKVTYEMFLNREVTEEEVKNIDIDCVKEIYEKLYWNPLRCNQLPSGIDLVLFDMGVNAGISRAAMILQQEIGGLNVDGIIGSKTLDSLFEFVNDEGAGHLIELYTEARICYYKSLHHYNIFGRGWTNRSRDVKKKALEMFERYG